MFDDRALLFACAITLVRVEHIALFILGSRHDPGLRASVIGLAGSTALGCGLLIVGSFAGSWQPWVWLLALVLDMSGPKFFGLEGWRLVPGHYAERFGLIVLIALGESIVAIGAGSGDHVDTGIVIGAILGVVVSAALFWLYFDVVALVAVRRLSNATPGREQNSIARDSFTYLHLPMVAGIVLVALGFKKTLGHVHAHLHVVPATALLGGTALYLLAHVAFRWRNVHRLTIARLGVSAFCVALIALAVQIPAIATLSVLAAVLVALIVWERRRFAELRQRLRHQLAEERLGPGESPGPHESSRSVVRERVEHVQPRGPAGGHRTGEDAGDGAGRDQRDQLADRERERHLQRVDDEGRDGDAEPEAEHAADVGRQHALVAHRAANLTPRGADGPHQADLAGALEHRQDQRVDDAEERDDQAQGQHHVDQGDDLVRVGLVGRRDLIVALHAHAMVALEPRANRGLGRPGIAARLQVGEDHRRVAGLEERVPGRLRDDVATEVALVVERADEPELGLAPAGVVTEKVWPTCRCSSVAMVSDISAS